MKKKIISTILVLIIAFALSVGAMASSQEVQIVENKTFDYQGAFEKFSPDDVVFTVAGAEVRWQEYFSWIYNVVMQYEMYYGAQDIWDAPSDDSYGTMEASFKAYAELISSRYAFVTAEAARLGVALSEEDMANIDAAYKADAEYYTSNGVADFEEFLKETYMDEEYYRYIIAAQYHYRNLFINAYGEDGADISDEEVMEFIDANQLLHAKHILLLTLDNQDLPLDDAAKAEKLATAESILSELKSIENTEERVARFETLMIEHSEDAGLIANPDGYYFAPNEMVSQFENGTKALSDYEISDIIESPYGYHIILRLPIHPDDIYEQGMSFRFLAASGNFDTDFTSNLADAEIIYTEKFENLKLEDIFDIITITEEIPVIPAPEEVEIEKDHSLIVNEENTQKLTYGEQFFLIAIIAILIYTVPVFVYRYRIKKCALENKAAIKFTAIYGVIMLVIVGTLLILANYFPIFVALIIWSYINYYVLSYKA
ncbi:MAG: peptidylprolyl isomerase [Oscillospiraceae bacterium]|nr:peptidylprolyl isomerase [Oscillospiraceae bacterium]